MHSPSQGSSLRHRSRNLRLLATFVLSAAALLLMVYATPANAADRVRKELRNSLSGLLADVVWGSTDDYQGVFLWPDNNSPSQEFDFLDSGNGYFRIKARHSGKCLMLDWRHGGYRNGTLVIQYPSCKAGYAPAEWQFRTVSSLDCDEESCSHGMDYQVLVNRETGKCLDAANRNGGRPPAQSYLQLWDCVTATKAWNMGNQAWELHVPGDKSFTY